MVKKNICVIGLGYIGLPTAVLLANSGFKVFGADTKSTVVEKINAGMSHIAEPNLDEYIKRAVASGFLKAFSNPRIADVYIICVPTPFHEDTIPKPNTQYVVEAALSIKDILKPGDLVIIESTCPVGTTQKIKDLYIQHKLQMNAIDLAYCPERVLPGRILLELIENDRIVGGINPKSSRAAAQFYRTFVKGDVFETTAETAEMCKLAENSYRDVNIAFANELSLLCHNAQIDVWKLIELANHHPRVNILQPGVGVGGHCIAVDPWFIVARDPQNSNLIKMARNVNNSKKLWVQERIIAEMERVEVEKGVKPRVACLGLTFKADVDDLRESPAIDIVIGLNHKGFEVVVVEPNIDEHSIFKLVNLEDALSLADIIVVLVKHKQFVTAFKDGVFEGSNMLDFCGINID